jgi:hypothetical protein
MNRFASFLLLPSVLIWPLGCEAPAVQIGPAEMATPAIQIGSTTQPAVSVTIVAEQGSFSGAVKAYAPVKPDLGDVGPATTSLAHGITFAMVLGVLGFVGIVALAIWGLRRRSRRSHIKPPKP